MLACSAPTAQSPKTPGAAPERIDLPRVVVSADDARGIDELLREADLALEREQNAEAAALYDRVFELDPRGPGAPDALFGAGTAYDLDARPRLALERYQRFFGLFPKDPRSRTAQVRSTRLYAYLEQFERAGQLADLILARHEDLRPFETIAVYSAKALSLVEAGDDGAASYFIGKARNVVEQESFDRAGEIPRDLAQLYYALGEVRRLRAERIRFIPVPEDFAGVLEARCQLLLDAQSSYSDVMRAHDAHWSAMAGFRVGELYQKLHEDLMGIGAPQTATDETKRLLFEGAMRLRYSILLEKARAMMKHTLAMAERTEERSTWVVRAEQAERQLALAEQREKEALDRLPYSRQQLQQALDQLASNQAAPGAAAKP